PIYWNFKQFARCRSSLVWHQCTIGPLRALAPAAAHDATEHAGPLAPPPGRRARRAPVAALGAPHRSTKALRHMGFLDTRAPGAVSCASFSYPRGGADDEGSVGDEA